MVDRFSSGDIKVEVIRDDLGACCDCLLQVILITFLPDVPGCHPDLQREVAYTPGVCDHLGSGNEVYAITLNYIIIQPCYKFFASLICSEHDIPL